MKNKSVVVIPTYNERETLPTVVAELLDAGLDCLVVDDNSPDGTGDLADIWSDVLDPLGIGPAVYVLHRPEKQGLGRAYVAGFERALEMGFGLIGQMDADLSHPPGRMRELFAAVRLGQADLAIGSRYIPGGTITSSWPKSRQILSKFGNLYARKILGLEPNDTTGAMRVWEPTLLADVLDDQPKSNGYCFLIEMLALAVVKHQAHWVEIPIHFAERAGGQTKMDWRIQAEAALRVWQIRGQLGGKATNE